MLRALANSLVIIRRRTSRSLGASRSVSSIRSGVLVPWDGVACTSTASSLLGSAGAVLHAALRVDLVRLAFLALLEALLEILGLLEALG